MRGAEAQQTAPVHLTGIEPVSKQKLMPAIRHQMHQIKKGGISDQTNLSENILISLCRTRTCHI